MPGGTFDEVERCSRRRFEVRAMSLVMESVTKDYPGGVRALDAVSLAIADGELVGIVGPSGSGKSTMLHIMGTLERPSAGRVAVAGADVAGLDDRELAGLRARRIGFFFPPVFLLGGMRAPGDGGP